ncbi:MAG: tagaturonate reductase [Anaerolineae bacterium]
MNALPRLNRTNHPVPAAYPERIVQFGAGNFLRAFVDWIVEILNQQAGFASSVVVVKVTPGTYAELDEQDGLFHVLLQGIQNGVYASETKLISCVSRTVYPYQDFAGYLALARQPEIRFLISNTTEAGIRYDENDRADDQPPTSFPAKLTRFLYERYQHFAGAADKGCIILPTELIENNGSQLREIILRYAAEWQLTSEFVRWIRNHNIFCNTLVDRIVSGFPTEQAAALQQQIGCEDRLLVAGETYLSWIIEAPPALLQELPIAGTTLNIKVVPNANPYRVTKVRILNGLHTSMVMLGYLAGLESVRDCVEQPDLMQFLQDEVQQEIIPSLDLPAPELEQFARDVFDRFRNPSIHHRLLTIAVNSTAKMRTRLLPTLQGYYDKRQALPARVVLALAAFIRLYKGEWHGEAVPIQDDAALLDFFKSVWQPDISTEQRVTAVLANQTLWGEDLNRLPGLHAQICTYLGRIETEGTLPIIQQMNASTA